MKPLVSAVIVNYNKKEVTAALLDSLRRSDFPKNKLEVIVVDNASSDGSQEFLKKKYSNVKLIENKANVHQCAGLNIGVRASNGKYVLILDNDIVVHRGAISQMVSVIEKYGCVAAVGPKMFNKNEEGEYFFGGYGTTTLTQFGALLNVPKDTKKLLNLFGIPGNFLYRKEILPTPYDPEYLAYAEDTYFSWLMRLKGFNVLTVPAAQFYHEGSVSYGIRSLSSFVTRIAERNRLLNMIIFYEPKNLVKLLPHIIFLNVFMNLYDPRHIPLRIRNYAYFLFNFPKILDKRKNIQKQRKVPDKEIIKLMSCKFFEPANFRNKLTKGFVKFLNKMSYIYCGIVGLRTIEFYQN